MSAHEKKYVFRWKEGNIEVLPTWDYDAEST